MSMDATRVHGAKGGCRMGMPDRVAWVKAFRGAAERTLGVGFSPESCRADDWSLDELGQRRALDRAFLRCILGPKMGKPEARDVAGRLWLLAAESAGSEPVHGLIAGTPGRLLWPPSEETIETSTEGELSGLHAAWRIAKRDGNDRLRARCLDAAAWSVENLQPDNATNRPWSAHVFVELWLARGDAGASLYAQTLVHNCQVSFGKPDRVSALVLWDASRELTQAD